VAEQGKSIGKVLGHQEIFGDVFVLAEECQSQALLGFSEG